MLKKACMMVVALVLLSTAPVMGAETNDLTGVWKSADGVTFYVRQLGNEIWWFGQQAPINPRWTNVAQGILAGNLVQVRWVDVPMGGTRHQGTLALRLVEPNHLKVVENPDNFLGADWYRK